jgi:hypothetical protein
MPSDEYTYNIKFWPTQVHRIGEGNISYDFTRYRFGQCIKSYAHLGELRKQKKRPNKEVFYIWVHALNENKYVLRSIVNCTDDQLIDSIRRCGEYVESQRVNRIEGEVVLDILYTELARRSEHARSLKDESNPPVGDSERDSVDTV